jgi:uncharacterized membrane protein
VACEATTGGAFSRAVQNPSWFIAPWPVASQVEATAFSSTNRLTLFAYGTLPAPMMAVFFPGALSFKAVVAASVAAAQAAYFLTAAEY